MDTITLQGPEDALILIPHLLGYRPSHHLVFLALESRGEDASGTRSCLGPIMSLDVEEQNLDLAMGLALARALRGSDIAQAVLVLYCPRLADLDPEGLRTLGMIAEVVDEALDEPEGKLFAVYAADATQWAMVVDATLAPQPWSVLESRPVAAAMVYAGSAPAMSAPPSKVSRRTSSERQEAVACGEAWIRDRVMGEVMGERLGCLEWDSLITLWKDPAKRARIRDKPSLFGRANLALSMVGVRDRLLHYGVNPGGGWPLSEIGGVELTRGLAQSMGARPDVSHLEELVELLENCASFAGEDDPCALSAAAYLLWWHGQNSSAARYVKEALAADADYPLAQLLADSLSGMVQPGWLLAVRQGET